MSDIFAGVYGARFPDVVMNSGPLPPSGRLPAPLHDTPDAKINYNSTLLGDLQPYAYGEPGYQSSQNSYLNVPHRIQKVLPVLYLPEPDGKNVFRLSHPVDDSDLAFVMRLNRGSIFCTGTRLGARQSSSLGVVADPIINLATLNYLLAGLQVSMPLVRDNRNLFWELLYNLDPVKWGSDRHYEIALLGFKDQDFQLPRNNTEPFGLEDLIHFVSNCVKPFGIVRGSEKQGGQSEMTNSASTWPVPFVATLVIDGKEGNVVNLWRAHDIHAGDDLVLRLKPMPIQQYTLNHYFKGFARKTYTTEKQYNIWQLVPDIFEMQLTADNDDQMKRIVALREIGTEEEKVRTHLFTSLKNRQPGRDYDYAPVYSETYGRVASAVPWQELGFWHIGRSQVMVSKYGQEFYNDDMLNNMRANHVQMTFQPVFERFPYQDTDFETDAEVGTTNKLVVAPVTAPSKIIEPTLGLERVSKRAVTEPHWQRRVRTHAIPSARGVSAGLGIPAAKAALDDPLPPAGLDAPGPLAALDAPPEPAALDAPPEPAALDAAPEPAALEAIPDLLPGLEPAEAAQAAKRPRAGRPKKATEAREPVDGMILKPGSEPVACRVELL